MNMNVVRALRHTIKDNLGRTKYFSREMFTVYPYMFSPQQLMFIASTALEQAPVAGCYIEVGCAEGATTAFVNRALAEERVAKRYICLDTFAGFPSEQVNYEIEVRGKDKAIAEAFTHNDLEWVRKSLNLADVHDVELNKADGATFDYASVAPIAWCLLDVDLYLPIAAALPKIYDALAPGGLIIVDDCQLEDERWDGALQAYDEVVAKRSMERSIVHGKLGIIRKPL
jgi:SAM-dependent methyltransferase